MPKLLEEVRARIRARHYSIRAEEAYLRRIREFILFHGKRRPAGMGAGEARDYLVGRSYPRDIVACVRKSGSFLSPITT